MRRVLLLAVAGSVVAGLAGPQLASGAEVEVRDTATGERCPAFELKGARAARGGCAFETFAENIDMSIVSPLGHFVFAECGASYKLRIDGHGRVLLQDFHVLGDSPCFDIESCFSRVDERQRFSPWRGKIRAPDGRLELVVNACLDTCVGHFEGPLVLRLRKSAHGWRALSGAGAIGDSGWELRGADWPLKPDADGPDTDKDGGPGIDIHVKDRRGDGHESR